MGPPGIGVDVEGVHAVAAALDAGRVTSLLVEAARREGVAGLLERAKAAGVEIATMEDLSSSSSTTSPQGIIARCRPIQPASLEQAAARVTPTALVVLDHLEDPRNVGAIARSAVAAGFSGMVMSSHRAAPLTAAAFKSAAGAMEHLDLVQVSSVADAVGRLRQLEVWTVGLDGAGDSDLFGLGLLTEPVALVVGAEGAGLSRLVRERVDLVASIPLDDRIESLNASVAAALAMFEVRRVRESGSRGVG